MSAGRFLQTDSPKNILGSFPEMIFEVLIPEASAARAVLEKEDGVLRSYPSGQALKVACRSGVSAEDVESLLEQAGISASSIEQVDPTFEDVFLSRESEKR